MVRLSNHKTEDSQRFHNRYDREPENDRIFLKVVILFLLTLLPLKSFAQDEEPRLIDNMALNGYAKYMNTVLLDTANNMVTDNLIHNRLNYTWYLNDHLTFKTSMRNRLFYGELVRNLGPYYATLGDDPGFFDLSILWASGKSTALHTVYDRLNLTWQKGNWEVIAGRQRINWAMSLVWNPNDLFNTYSFFDFDYEERPGSDAIMVNYYTGASSSMSVVYQLADSIEASTFAIKYKFTTNNYDLQFLGGYQKQFYTVGMGWAGDIKGAGFKGEATYFVPQSGSNGDYQFIGSFDLDYTISSGPYVHFSYLFNSVGLNSSTGNYAAFYLDRSLSVQTLSPAMHNLFLETSGPISPILTGSLAAMMNPADRSWFVGPGFTWSVVENFDFLAFAQLFRGNPSTLYGDGGSFIFMRFKYSF